MSGEDFTGPDLGLIANNYPEFYELAKKYDEDGYAILDLDISTNFNVSIIEDIKNIITKSTFKKNPEIYHYNESPRIVEAWKQSMHIKDLALNLDILNVLTVLYGKNHYHSQRLILLEELSNLCIVTTFISDHSRSFI